MKLFDVYIPYTPVDGRVLRLGTKPALLRALELYGGRFVLRGYETPYLKRQRKDSLQRLKDAGIVSDIDGDGCPILTPLTDKFEIPSKVDWATLSLAEAKTLIAVYREAHCSRRPYFVFTMTLAELARVSGLECTTVSEALRSLSEKNLLIVSKQRSEGVRGVVGTRVELRCPESGVSLNRLSQIYEDRFRNILPNERYSTILREVDPKLKGSSGFTGDTEIQTDCPFCGEREFRFTCRLKDGTFDCRCVCTCKDKHSVPDPYCRKCRCKYECFYEDRWKCFACGQSGDSVRLWVKWHWRYGRPTADEALTALRSAVEKPDKPEIPTAKPSYGEGMEDVWNY